MNLEKITIKNYKSIRDITIDNFYHNDSGANFLLGLNEAGKSNILSAINLLSSSKPNLNYKTDCNKEAYKNKEPIEVDIHWSLLPDEIAELNKLITQREGAEGAEGADGAETLGIDFKHYNCFVVNTYQLPNNGESINTWKLFIKNGENELSLHDVVNSFNYKDEQAKNSWKGLLKDINSYCIARAGINYWASNPKFLVGTIIDLEKFKEEPHNISIPLTNIFHLAGYKDNPSIKKVLDDAFQDLKDGRGISFEELKIALNKAVNDSLFKEIWKEHKISIEVSFNNKDCSIHVADEQDELFRYMMNERSQGFQQFASLILSLSCSNRTKEIGGLILIDEPDIHLHPSGVRYMRDELLKIGESAALLIATHSVFMVDKKCPERHLMVKKEGNDKLRTVITRLNKDDNIMEEEVMRQAFGLNYLKEILPENIFLVEGKHDKKIIECAMRKLYPDFHFAIKDCNGSELPKIAKLFAQDKIPIKIIVDADECGRCYKKECLKIDGYDNHNAFLITDLNNSTGMTDITIEDFLDREFFIDVINQQFPNKDIVINILNREKDSKEKTNIVIIDLILKALRQKEKTRNDIKNALADEFVAKFSNETRDEMPQIVTLINNLYNKCQNN